MKKLFLKLNTLSLLIVSNISLVACSKTVTTRANGNQPNENPFDMDEAKDFNLESFTADDFQSFANNEISKKKKSSFYLERQIENMIWDTVFEQIIGSKTNISNELKALKKFNENMISIKFELINKNQQLKTVIELNNWENIENEFKDKTIPNSHCEIKGLAKFGLDNVKKYYDHIKNNKTEFTIEYGDKTFYRSIESPKKILEEDNKNNIDDYQFYVDPKRHWDQNFVCNQINKHLNKIFKNQTEVRIKTVYYEIEEYNYNLKNDLKRKEFQELLKLKPNKMHQTVVEIKDKNGYSEYIPIKFQVKDINLLIEEIKQIDFSQLISYQSKVSDLSFAVEKYIRETFKETKNLQVTVNVLNEQQTSELKNMQNYTLEFDIQQIFNFQIKLMYSLPNIFNKDIKKIEQDLVVPPNFYAGINNEVELKNKIKQNLEQFYGNDKFNFMYIQLNFLDENSEREYENYRNKFGNNDKRKLDEFDNKKILAPIKYLLKISVYLKDGPWIGSIEKIISITEKP